MTLAEEDEAVLFTPKLTRRLVGAGLFAVMVYSAWLFWIDVDALGESLSAAGPASVLAGVILSTLNYALRALRWHAYLGRLGLDVSRADSAIVFTSGFAMTVTPAKMGEVIKSVLLKQRYGVPIATSAPVVVAERVTDLAGLILLAALGSLTLGSGLPLAIAGALTVVGLLLISSCRPLGELVFQLFERIPKLQRITARLREAYQALLTLSSLGSMLYATLLSTLAWALQCAGLWLIAGAVQAEAIGLLESCLSYSAPLLAGTLAMIPGGLGLTEASMTGVLIALSEPTMALPQAMAIALLVRLVTFWWAVLLGFMALLLWRTRYGLSARTHRCRMRSPSGDERPRGHRARSWQRRHSRPDSRVRA